VVSGGGCRVSFEPEDFMPLKGPDYKIAAPLAAGAGPKDARRRLLVLPQARHWILTGMVLAAAVFALGLTVQTAPGLTAGELSVDQDLSRHHSVILTGLAMTLNLVYGPVFGVVVILLIALFLLLVRRAPVNAVAFGLVASSGWVASEIFKVVIARNRPDPALLFDALSPETGSNSFPSGHVSFAVALGFALYLLARGTRWGAGTAVGGGVMALVVAWSRLYIGVHYPSDVAASFLAAGAALVLLTGLWNRYASRMLERLPVNALTRPFLS
jgi:membrane-associated phospholipid phosphatase